MVDGAMRRAIPRAPRPPALPGWAFGSRGPSSPIGSVHRAQNSENRMHLLSALLSEGSLIDLDGTFFIQMGLFFVAFLVLKVLVFGPVIRLIEKRDEMIDGAKKEAKELQSDASSAEDKLAAEMRAARLKAGEEREKLRAEGKRLEAQVLEKVREETSKQLSEAETALDKEAAKVRTELKAQTPALAKQIASKLLEREVA
jgi:F-type H+-transporting ATPase subunit b